MENKVREVLIKELNLSRDADVSELKYGVSPNWDSSGQLNLALALEDSFGVEFGPEEMVKLVTHADICEQLRRKGISK